MCNTCTPGPLSASSAVHPEFSHDKSGTSSAFATAPQQLLQILNNGATALGLSLGHRTGLFDTMANLPPSTSQAIADAARLNERYVREWLGIMVTSGIVHYDPDHRHYHLPQEYAALLTRAAGADNFATVAQFLPLLGSVEDRIVECFRRGGGVAYEHYSRFHEIMAEESGQTVLSALEDQILSLVPGLIKQLDIGIAVADVGCGRGRAIHALAKRFPESYFTGYDLSVEAIEYAQQQRSRQGLDNLTFIRQDAATLRESDRFDLVFTFDAVHDQARPDQVLRNIYRMLKPNGVYIMQDIDAHSEVADNRDHPLGPLLYTISCMHCMSVSLAANGAGLGAVWGVELAQKMLREAGFSDVRIERLPHDIQNCFYIVKK